MKKRNIILFCALTILCAITSCEKDNETTKALIKISELSVTKVDKYTAEILGYVTNKDNREITTLGICYNTSGNPNVSDKYTTASNTNNQLNCVIENLKPNTTYFARAFATDLSGTVYSKQVEFTTQEIPLTQLQDITIDEVNSTSASFSGGLISTGESEISKLGICYGQQPLPDISNEHVLADCQKSTFDISIDNLTPNTKYFARAFATDDAGTVYSKEIEFTTTETPIIRLKDITASNITTTSAILSGGVLATGNSPISQLGICYGQQSSPDLSNHHVLANCQNTSFDITLTNLSPNTQYFARTFATDDAGTIYGNEITFTTSTEETLPTEVAPLIQNSWSVFNWPYNAYYPTYNGQNAVNGHYPAACGPTALARILGYWAGKIKPKGEIDAMNTWNEVRFQCDLNNLNIDYNNLPSILNQSATEAQYKNVAKIFLAAGAVGLTNMMDLGTPPDSFTEALKKHFTVSSNVRLARRWDYTRVEWIQLLKQELAKGNPIAIAARTADSPAPGQSGNVNGHWFNIDGYNADNEFHISYNYGWNNFEGYYDVDNFGDFNSYGIAIIGFQPAE